MKCNVCGSEDCEIKYVGLEDIEQRYVTGKFNYYKCKMCTAIFMYPMPELNKIIEFYNPSYSPHQKVVKKKKTYIKEAIKKYFGFLFLDKSIMKKYKQIFKNLDKPLNEIKILEYGCGSCGQLYLLKEEFNLNEDQILGVDFSQNAIDGCNAIEINAKRMNSLTELENQKFDVISAFQLLEHLNNPKEFIEQAYKLLNDGGVIYLELPNYNSFGRKYFEKYWEGLDVPRHLVQYNKKSLEMLMNEKFQVINISTNKFFTESIKIKHGHLLGNRYWSDNGMFNIIMRVWFGNFLSLLGKGDNLQSIFKKSLMND